MSLGALPDDVGGAPNLTKTKAQKRQVKKRIRNRRKQLETTDPVPSSSLHESQQSLDQQDDASSVVARDSYDGTIIVQSAQGVDHMAARSNRPRSGPANPDRDDAHEERTMWEQITRDLRRIKAINDRAREVGRLILEKEDNMAKRKCL